MNYEENPCQKMPMGACCCDCELNIPVYARHSEKKSIAIGHVCIKKLSEGRIELIDLTVKFGDGHGFCHQKRYGTHWNEFEKFLKNSA